MIETAKYCRGSLIETRCWNPRPWAETVYACSPPRTMQTVEYREGFLEKVTEVPCA
jgi:hypothetical protein